MSNDHSFGKKIRGPVCICRIGLTVQNRLEQNSVYQIMLILLIVVHCQCINHFFLQPFTAALISANIIDLHKKESSCKLGQDFHFKAFINNVFEIIPLVITSNFFWEVLVFVYKIVKE